MRTLCKCGCGVKLRKDNRTGYQRGHKPCPICEKLVTKSHTECCSKSCSAQLHWKRHPEMKGNRTFNTKRFAVRETNRTNWIKNLSEACKGRIPWNKGTKGLQIPWNKGLTGPGQSFYGKKHAPEYYIKRDSTVFERYGIKYATELTKSSPRSQKEKSLEKFLSSDYKTNVRIGKFKPDYVNEITKHIIEVYGDYWHCNPTKFSADYYNSKLRKTAQEKWDYDERRIAYLESLGYTVSIIWESKLPMFVEEQTALLV